MNACAHRPDRPPTGGEIRQVIARQVLINLGTVTIDQWWPLAARLAEGVVCANMLVDTTIVEPLRYIEHNATDLGPLGFAWPIQGATRVIETGEGNCLDLACLFAAQYRKRQRRATVGVRVNPNKLDAHCYIRVGGGWVDPQELLPNGVL